MPKKTPLSDPDNIMVVWDDEPAPVVEETPAARRKRLRPVPKTLRRRQA